MSLDVFISHSSTDATAAKAACAALEAAKIRCWIAPRDIAPGARWAAAIVRAITQARAMVLIFSGSANTSAQVQREVDQAFSNGKPVIPLRIEDVKPGDDLAFYLNTVHWLDALTPPLERNLEKLVVTVQALLAATEAGLPSQSAGGEAEAAAPDISPERDGEDPKLQESQRQEQLEIDARAREADARQRAEAEARSRWEVEQARAGAPPKPLADEPKIKSPATARQSTPFTAPKAGNLAAKIPGRAALNAVGVALGAQGLVQMALWLCVLFAKGLVSDNVTFDIVNETKWVLAVMAFVSTATIVSGLLVLTRALRPFRAIGLATCATNIVCSVLWIFPFHEAQTLSPYVFTNAMEDINLGVGYVFISTIGAEAWIELPFFLASLRSRSSAGA